MKHRWLLWFTSCLCLLASLTAQAAEDSRAALLMCPPEHIDLPLDVEGETLKEKIRGILIDYNVPGATVVAVQDSSVVLHMNWGLASSRASEVRCVQDDTTFLLASLSKLVTAVTVLAMMEDEDLKGKHENLSLDSKIQPFLGFKIDFPKDYPTQKNVITFRDLLNHVSGIVDNNDLMDCVYTINANSPVSLGEFVRGYLTDSGAINDKTHCTMLAPRSARWMTQRPLPMYNPETNFGPPGIFSYSNVGYTLLGYLIERVTGEPAWQYSQRVVLDKLKLSDQGPYAGRWLLSQLPHEKRAAKGEGTDASGTIWPHAVRPYGDAPQISFPGYTNGGFRCTGLALGRFLNMLVNDGSWIDEQGQRHLVLKPETVRAITGFSARPQAWTTLTSLGFGIRTDYVSESPLERMLIGHTGR